MDIEPSTLIWIIRTIFLLAAAWISYGIWRWMRRERFYTVPARKTYEPPTHIELPEKNIALSIMAQPGRVYDTQHLFKVMEALGFNYADSQIFEYILPNTQYIAFSIINVRTPHTFSQSPQEMHPTNGLMAIMQLPVADGDNQVEHFHLFLSILDELRTNLDADICDTNRTPLKNKKLYEMQKDIEQFEQHYHAKIQHDYQSNDH